jgi:hypothetical protein
MSNSGFVSYEQAVVSQAHLVRTRRLNEAEVHEIAETEERPDFGSVWVRCTCGAFTSFRAAEAERGERLYLAHVLEALQATFATAA